jgi:hypothetical protein
VGVGPPMTTDEVLARLKGVTGRGPTWQARCPAHDDRKPSLTVTDAGDKTLLHCKGGCSTESIVSTMGLTMADLFLEASPNGNGRAWMQEDADAALANRGLRPETIKYFDIQADLERQAWSFPLGKRRPRKFKRFRATGGDKCFFLKGESEPISTYHLGPCHSQPEAWLVEGEPDVWIAHQAGLVAFTFTGGASVVKPEMVEAVKAANIGIVHVVYDRDEAGAKGMQKVAEAFTMAEVRLDLRELPASVGKGGDITTLYNNVDCDDERFRQALDTLPVLPSATTPLTSPNRLDAPPGATLPDKPESLGEAALYGPLGEYVSALREETESHPAAILAQALVYFGVMVGRGPSFSVGRDLHHPNEFVLIVGGTSDGKGTSWADAQAPFRLLDRSALPAVRGGLTSAEGLAYHVRDARDKDPGIQDKRLLVVETEFSSVLVRARREANSLSQTIRQSWDDGSIASLSKNEPTIATNAHIGIVGHITPTDVRAHLSHTDASNGFGNRFLLVWAERQRDLPLGGNVPAQVVESHARRLIAAATEAEGIDQMRFSPGAEVRWSDAYHGLRQARPGVYGLMVQRAAPHVLRLAMIYALTEGSAVIGVEHLNAALALWTYCDQTAAYLFPPTAGGATRDKITALLAEARTNGLTRTALHHRFGGRLYADELDRELAALQQEDAVWVEKVATGGRHAEVWRIRP